MAKLLRPQDILLLGLAGVGDIFEEIRDPLGIMSSSCKTMYGWVPPNYKRHNFYTVVSHSLKTGYIEKIIKNDESYLRLTPKGKEKVKRDFSYFFLQKKKWDRKWRVVIFDIEEIKRGVRNALREKLKELGFGMLQESVWVTPHDVAEDFREVLETQGLAKKVFVLVVEKLLAGDEKELVAQIWELENLNNAYQSLLEDYDGKRNLSEREGEEWLRTFRAKYLEILRKDPCLPRELLPRDWLEEKVRRLIQNLK